MGRMKVTITVCNEFSIRWEPMKEFADGTSLMTMMMMNLSLNLTIMMKMIVVRRMMMMLLLMMMMMNDGINDEGV